jgi:holo-[acyl-carrier protein] synthase
VIVGTGIDLIEMERIRAIQQRHPQRFIDRILTVAEKEYVLQYKDPTQRLAGRFAAKEAALKALGTGVDDGIGWKDVEILPDARGKPLLSLHGKAALRAQSIGATVYHVTITHSDTMAMAHVLLEKT